ncbi:Hint domain-containing protein [Spartinivicinus poritis]|uniref:Hint domain-containing protein n=1 Tax=Spartinivicinus poritis TaxID=2994640 RepID=A0ABT5UCD9_9GAMM|nr:Hint domain-containing protein [Spartinivicinus sp. A2-2]MDE1464043.1 Hint domain-containing protein [Spartinivicinus sp. A2-2]
MTFIRKFSGALAAAALAFSGITAIAHANITENLSNNIYENESVSSNYSSHQVDMSNPDKRAFIYDRLAKANKTPENSPQLFQQLKRLEKKQIKKIFHDSADESPQQQFSKLHIPLQPKGLNSAGKVYSYLSVLLTTEKNADYRFIDVSLMHDDTQVGTYNSKEAFGPLPKNNRLQVSSLIEREKLHILHRKNIKFLEAVSIYMIDNGGTTEVFESKFKVNVKQMLSLIAEPGRVIKNGIHKVNVFHPADNVYNDNKVVLCLKRKSTDCDYSQMKYSHASEKALTLPLKGEIYVDLTGVKIISETGLEGANVNGTSLVKTNMYLINDNGRVAQFKTLAELDIQKYVKVEYDDELALTKIFWDIPQNEGFFANGSFSKHMDEVRWVLLINVEHDHPILGDRRKVKQSYQFDSFPHEEMIYDTLNVFNVSPIHVRNSCLVEGSLITMQDGSKKKIENIKVGDWVSTKNKKQPLMVKDLSIGTEDIPMYKLVTESNTEVVATEKHIIPTNNKGLVWVKELEIGDQLFTENGIETIKSVTQQQYSGKVYNLFIGLDDVTVDSFSASELTFYANSVLVGDNNIQSKFEYKDQWMSEEEVLNLLPKQWHQDYYHSKQSD